MSRILALGAFLALFLAPAVSFAAPATEKSNGPTVMLRVQSVEKLLDNAEYIAALAGQEELAKQFIGFVRALTDDKKGIEGIDIKKPFALYANLAPEILNSEVILMIPIADKDAFIDLLKTRLALEIKEDKGLYSTEAPNNAGAVYFRFANDYVYGTFLNKDNVDLKKLPKPADVVGKGESVLSLNVRIDRVPEEMKKFALGAIEEKLQEGKKQPLPNETPSIKTVKEAVIDSLAGGLKSILTDGEEITIKLDVDAKKDELALEFNMTAKKGSELAKDFAGLKTKKSVSFGSLAARNSALMLAVNVSLPPSVKKAMGPAIDELVKLGLGMAPEEIAKLIDPLVKSLVPTFKAGDLDAGVVLLGPDAENKYTAVVAAKIVKGKDVEKSVKEVLKSVPAEISQVFDLDADTAGEHKLHAVRVKGFLDDNAKKLFGESDIWLAFRDDAVLISFGPKGKDALKEALKAAPATGSLAKIEVSVSRLIALADLQAGKDGKAAKKAAEKVFGKNPNGGDTVVLTVDGGESLRIRAALKGKVIKFIVEADKAKGDN